MKKINLVNIIVPVLLFLCVIAVFNFHTNNGIRQNERIYEKGNDSREFVRVQQKVRDYEEVLEWVIKRGAF